MNLAFSSWQALFYMGGYAFYVWIAVVITLFSLLALVWHTLRQYHQLIEEIRRHQIREQCIRYSQLKSNLHSSEKTS